MKNQRGFTLLEVLVAMTIMAVAVVGLLSALTTSARNASRLTEYDRASQLAKRKMDELLALKRLPRGMPLEGGFTELESGGVESGWRAVITPTEAPPNATPVTPVLDRVDLEVWWKAGDQRRTFTLETYRTYVPPQQNQPQPQSQVPGQGQAGAQK